MNFLILRLSSMGDVIHTLPAMRALRSTFPDSKIGWVVEDAHSEVLLGLPEIDRVFLLPRERMKAGWTARRELKKEFSGRLREVRWDLAIDFQGLWKSLLVARWSGAKRIVGYAPSPERTHWFYSERIQLPTMDRHAVDRNLDLVAVLGASVHRAELRGEFHRDFSLPILPGHRNAALACLASQGIDEGNSRILLNFAARKPANKWGTDRFAELARRLVEKRLTPILTGGPADRDEEKEIQSKLGTPIPSLVGKCSLMELAAVMERCDVLVTGDTGPMHIAVAARLPVVALFGPANPVRTGPYAPDAVVLQEPRECQPCYARHCKFGEEPPPCMLDLTVERVVKEVEKIVGVNRAELKLRANPSEVHLRGLST